MQIVYRLPYRQTRPTRPLLTPPPEEPPQGRSPRIARLIALAHRLDGLVRSGQVKDYTALAQLGEISTARLSQILILLHLAPPIQEYVLHLSAGEESFVTERQLRAIAREPSWNRQKILFDKLLGVENQPVKTLHS